jgi:hypothetical protein
MEPHITTAVNWDPTKRIRWVRDIVHVGEIRNSFVILGGNAEGKSPLNERGTEGRTILKFNFK